MTIVLEQFDGVIADLEAAIVSHEVGDEQSGEFIVDVRELENCVDDFSRSSASAGTV